MRYPSTCHAYFVDDEKIKHQFKVIDISENGASVLTDTNEMFNAFEENQTISLKIYIRQDSFVHVQSRIASKNDINKLIGLEFVSVKGELWEEFLEYLKSTYVNDLHLIPKQKAS
ncbi:MAG: PilZ domain-containing protein [Bdellovibrionales bacterium]